MKEKVAVVFGTFAPLHQGHIDLIQRAKRQCDRVCVIVSGYKGDRGEEVGLPLQNVFAIFEKVFQMMNSLRFINSMRQNFLAIPWDGNLG